MNRTRYPAVPVLALILLLVVGSAGLGPPRRAYGYRLSTGAPLISDDRFLFHPSADATALRRKLATIAPKLASKQPSVGDDRLDLAGLLVRAASDRDYDINPFVLLSLLVASGRLNAEVESAGDLDYALNHLDPAYRGVQSQLTRVARDLARAFWARKLEPSSNQTIRFENGREILVENEVNAGTYAVQAAIAKMDIPYERWAAQVSGERPLFRQVYSQLGGDAPNETSQTYGPTATTIPFLRKPFDGSYGVNSWFDHEYPNYNQNGTIVVYTGERRTKAGTSECTLGYNCYDGHSGIDFGTGRNPIVAAAGGNATTYRNYDDGNGCGLVNAVIIDHGGGYKTKYWHLGRVDISDGWVQEGTQVGLSGSTGCATGPHLHFSVTLNDVAVDPYGWSGGYSDPWSAQSTWLWKNGSQPIHGDYALYLPFVMRSR
ncbi:MAG: M23 family metallopeptidase [Chloroflexi bacterium]|nr:M23 family metallopeptidase [Chloroflexota bacterium]